MKIGYGMTFLLSEFPHIKTQSMFTKATLMSRQQLDKLTVEQIT